MSEIKERLDKVRALIQESEFLEGKGLSNRGGISESSVMNPENENGCPPFCESAGKLISP